MWKARVKPSFHCIYTLLIIILNNIGMKEKKLKKVGYKVLVYWYDQQEADVIMLHRITKEALSMWINTLLSDMEGSVTRIEVEQFYY